MTFEPFVMPVRRLVAQDPRTIPKSVEDNRYYSKNAFRYICRIAMKEGCNLEYKLVLEDIAKRNNCTDKELTQVLLTAENVSGPRYF